MNEHWFAWQSEVVDEVAASNPVNRYIDAAWRVLAGYELTDDTKFEAVSALSCDFVRRQSANSCFDDNVAMVTQDGHGMIGNGNGICDDMDAEQLEAMTLLDLYQYTGDDNECLLRIRRETWPYSKDHILLKQALCSGEFDYGCNAFLSDQVDLGDISGIIGNLSRESHELVPSSREFFAFNMSLWSVLVWASMFIFVAMTMCYMFCVKKNYERERMFKQDRDNAYIAIYGAVGAV